MSEIDKSKNNIWSFLLLSGYLKAISRRFDENSSLYVYKLKIPNIEIKTLYRTIIDKWFSDSDINSEYNNMIKALTLGDIKNFNKLFKRCVMQALVILILKDKIMKMYIMPLCLGC